MARWQPDPSFYPTAQAAMQGPAEQLAYVVTLNTSGDGRPDALCVLDLEAGSPTRERVFTTRAARRKFVLSNGGLRIL